MEHVLGEPLKLCEPSFPHICEYNCSTDIYPEELFSGLEIMTASCLIQYQTHNKCAINDGYC